MIADDNPVERAYLTDFLSQHFSQDFSIIGEARDGSEVLELSRSGLADLYLLDIQMPKLNGLEAAEQLKHLYPEVAILFITSYADFAYVRKALQLGVADYLLKPYVDAELEETLHKILTRLDARLAHTPQTQELALVDLSLYKTHKVLDRIVLDGETWHSLDTLLVYQKPRLEAYKTVVLYPCSKEGNTVGLITALKTMFCKRQLHALVTIHNQEITLYLFGDRVKDFQDLDTSIQRARTFFLDEQGDEIFCGVSSFFTDVRSLGQAYQEAATFITDFAPQELSTAYAEHAKAIMQQYQSQKRLLYTLLNHKMGEFTQEITSYLELHHQEEEILYLTYLFLSAIDEILGRNPSETERKALPLFAEVAKVQDREAYKHFLLATAASLASDLGEGGAYHNVHLVRKAIRIITERFSEKLTLQQIADELEVSYSHLSKCFKQVSGSSFNAFLLDIRMQEAVHLFSTSKQGIAEVGKQVGIDDPYYFSKSFRKYASMSPSEFIAMHTLSRNH